MGSFFCCLSLWALITTDGNGLNLGQDIMMTLLQMPLSGMAVCSSLALSVGTLSPFVNLSCSHDYSLLRTWLLTGVSEVILF